MHVSLVICLINLINAHGDDEDHEKAAEPTELPELPEAKPPIDNGQINAEVDLPIECTGSPIILSSIVNLNLHTIYLAGNCLYSTLLELFVSRR